MSPGVLAGALVGGEVAAAVLTRHLVPARGALHLSGAIEPTLRALRLLPDRDGPIDLFRRFGTADAGPVVDGLPLVHPLLVRAELLVQGDSRLDEVAGRLLEQRG